MNVTNSRSSYGANTQNIYHPIENMLDDDDDTTFHSDMSESRLWIELYYDYTYDVDYIEVTSWSKSNTCIHRSLSISVLKHDQGFPVGEELTITENNVVHRFYLSEESYSYEIPSTRPTSQPTSQPSVQPSVQPSLQPSSVPTAMPTFPYHVTQNLTESGASYSIRNHYAMAALTSTGEVIAWGDPIYGGDDTNLNACMDNYDGDSIDTVISSLSSFAALTVQGHVCFWGAIDPSASDMQNQLYDIITVVANEYDTYACLRTDGKIITIGNKIRGGGTIIDTAYNTDLIDFIYLTEVNIVATAGAFAVLKKDRTVTAWGDAIYGGRISNSLTATLSTPSVYIDKLYSTRGAFSVLTTRGIVYSWGHSGLGGEINGDISTHHIADVFSNTRSFAALTKNREIITWGEASSGGEEVTSSSLPSSLLPLLSL